MGRKRMATTKVNMGGRFEVNLATRFSSLAKENGVSMREALRRLMVQAILANRIPGVDSLDLESREHEKWGAATPTYEAEMTPRTRPDGQKAPVHPVE